MPALIASNASFRVAYAVGPAVPAVASTSIGPAVSHVPIETGIAVLEMAASDDPLDRDADIPLVQLKEYPAREITERVKTTAASLNVRDDKNILLSIVGDTENIGFRRTNVHGNAERRGGIASR